MPIPIICDGPNGQTNTPARPLKAVLSVFFSDLSPPSLMLGWLFWMRLDLTPGITIGAPGSWPGLMGLAGLDTERKHLVTCRKQVETSHVIQSPNTVLFDVWHLGKISLFTFLLFIWESDGDWYDSQLCVKFARQQLVVLSIKTGSKVKQSKGHKAPAC